MKTIIRAPGSASQIEYVYITQDAGNTSPGDPLTGLAYDDVGALAYYLSPGGLEVQITLATQTVDGAWSAGGFVEVDATNHPGLYRFDPPDALYASGVVFRILQLVFPDARVEPVEVVLAPSVDVDRINGSSESAVKLAAAAAGIVTLTVQTGSTEASVLTDLAEATIDHYKNKVLVITSGVALGQHVKVGAYDGSGVLSSLTEGPGTNGELLDAPANGDTGVLV